MSEATDLIDSATAAQILNISRATLTRWVQSGRLQSAAELKGARVFRRADVEALAADLVTEASA